MSFLAPLFLLGLLAVAIPVAIHLIRRDKPPRVMFSTLRFFQNTSRKQFLFQKFQQWLLLALRALAICLLAFAFARPFFSQNLGAFSNLAPRSVAIVFDVSMSMAYGDYLERAKDSAIDVLDELSPGDEAAIIFMADEVVAVQGLTSELNTLRTAINDFEQPVYRATRYFPGLRLADEMLGDASFEDKSVYLVSDFQKLGMEDFDKDWKLAPGVNFVTENIADEDTTNLAVTGVKVPASTRSGVEEHQLFVRVRTLGSVKQNMSSIAVSADGENQSTQTVDLSQQSEVVIEVPARFAGEGSHIGKVSVSDSRFDTDNDYHFTLDVLPKIPVLVVNGEASDNWYDDESHWFSLAVGGDAHSPFDVSVIDDRQLNTRQLTDAGVVVLLNVGSLSDGQAQALVDYVNNGGSLLMAPGDRVQAGRFNQQLSSISPAALVDRTVFNNTDYLLIADIERRHPILRPLEVDWNVRFDGHWIMKPEEGAEVLMRFDNGEPALVEQDIGNGRVLLFGSSLDLEWNNMPLQGVYLPFVHEMLKHLSRTPDKQNAYTVGDKIQANNFVPGAPARLENDNESPPTRDTGFEDPDGNPVSLLAGESSITFSKPGIYTRHYTDREGEASQLYFAVNTPIEESDFASVAPGDILDRILNPETTPIQSAAVRTQLMKEELEKPQRLWWWVLLVVLALMIAEAFVANRTYR